MPTPIDASALRRVARDRVGGARREQQQQQAEHEQPTA